MTREEYLNSRKADAKTYTAQKMTREEYLEARKHCEEFACSKIEYTAEDFELFDANFNKVLEALTYHDTDLYDDSEVEEICARMHMMDWKWQGKEVDKDMFLKTVKDLYERCLQGSAAEYSCSTGGITVKTDLYEHRVEFKFGMPGIYYYDGGCDADIL